MDMSSTIGQKSSANYLHGELVIEPVVLFEKRYDLSLYEVDRIVIGVVSQSVKMDIEWSFT